MSTEETPNGPYGIRTRQNVSSHDLLNEATEWIQYASGMTELLADLVHEADEIDCKRLSLGLEAIVAMARVGVQRTAQAHSAMHWEEVDRMASLDDWKRTLSGAVNEVEQNEKGGDG